MGPINAIRQKRLTKHATKPTAIAKITSRQYINPQAASPFFTIIPAEIRIQIFEYALLGYPDSTKPYSQHSFWYRPGYTHARGIATSLLLTCRRVYLETDLLPLQLNEHVVWGVERSRIPPNTTCYLLNNRLKTSQKSAIQYVHLFVQQFWLEDWKDQWLTFSKSWPDGFPKRLRITIRHTDWWYNLLGENSPLALDPKRKGRAQVGEWISAKEPFEKGSWGQRFNNLKGLEKLELELETVESKRPELDASVDKAPSWKFPLGDGNVLVMDQKAIEKSTWTGSKHFKGLNASAVAAGLQLRQGSTASFKPFKSASKQRVEAEELAEEDCLDYYVVTLTWRAQPVPVEENAAEDAGECLTSNTTNSGASIGATAAPTQALVTAPRVSYNRFNAVPTFYG